MVRSRRSVAGHGLGAPDEAGSGVESGLWAYRLITGGPYRVRPRTARRAYPPAQPLSRAGLRAPREGGLRMTGADRCAGRVSRIGGAVLPAPPFLRHRGAGQGSHRGALSRVRRGGPLPEHLAGDADVVRRRTLAPIVALKSSIPYGLGGSFPCAEQHQKARAPGLSWQPSMWSGIRYCFRVRTERSQVCWRV